MCGKNETVDVAKTRRMTEMLKCLHSLNYMHGINVTQNCPAKSTGVAQITCMTDLLQKMT